MTELLFSDGKTLEIEKILNCTIFLPQICYFCDEEIIKMRGRDSNSLVFHSLDGNHNNWESVNKKPCHRSCHGEYHSAGERNAMYGVHKYGEDAPNYGNRHTEEAKQKMSEKLKGIKPWNAGKKHTEKQKQNMKRTNIGWMWAGERNGMSGNLEAAKRGWETRRRNHGPSGFKGEHSMKRPEQRERFSRENPMKNPESVAKMLKTKRDRGMIQ